LIASTEIQAASAIVTIRKAFDIAIPVVVVVPVL
jgi:hypothetical protein